MLSKTGFCQILTLNMHWTGNFSVESQYKWLQVDDLDEGIIGIQLRSRANLKDFIKCGWPISCCDYTFIGFFPRLLFSFVCLGKWVLLFVYEVLFHLFSTTLANMKSRSTWRFGEENYSSSKSHLWWIIVRYQSSKHWYPVVMDIVQNAQIEYEKNKIK